MVFRYSVQNTTSVVFQYSFFVVVLPMSTSIYFTLLVVHTYYYSQHIDRREGGGLKHILSVNLFTCFHFPTLLVSCTHFVFLGSVEYIVSCHCFGIETVGKEKIYIIIFHFWGKRKIQC